MRNYDLVCQAIGNPKRFTKKLATRPDVFEIQDIPLSDYDIESYGGIYIEYDKNKNKLFYHYLNHCDFHHCEWRQEAPFKTVREAENYIRFWLQRVGVETNNERWHVIYNVNYYPQYDLVITDADSAYPYRLELVFLNAGEFVIKHDTVINRSIYTLQLPVEKCVQENELVAHLISRIGNYEKEYNFRNLHTRDGYPYGFKPYRTKAINFKSPIYTGSSMQEGDWVWRKTHETEKSVWFEPVPIDEIYHRFGINEKIINTKRFDDD